MKRSALRATSTWLAFSVLLGLAGCGGDDGATSDDAGLGSPGDAGQSGKGDAGTPGDGSHAGDDAGIAQSDAAVPPGDDGGPSPDGGVVSPKDAGAQVDG